MTPNRITPDNIIELKENEIFVFGSNLSGAHGGGAALTAIKWGAVTGQATGLQGQTYAIPTKSKGAKETLTLDKIKPHADDFIKFAQDNPKMHFYLTEVGCGLAGIKPEDIAPLFAAAMNVNNIALPKKFWSIIMPVVRGFKVTNSDMTCRKFQYELGKQYTNTGKIGLCEEGFHFCEIPNNCFEYYDFNPRNRVFEIEATGNIIQDDKKSVAEKITFIRELTWYEVLNLVNSGSNNTGRGNTGDRNTGDRNTGDRNTGDRNTGDRNTGDRNTGDRNTGYSNTGDRNTGYRNTGDRNTGDRNTGDWNTGDRNTGYSNTGDRNTGAFCNTDAPFPMFNKPSAWTEKDFRESKAFMLMRSSVDTKMWVPLSRMTEDEKAAYPASKTAEGYVKDIPFKEAFTNAWHNWDESSRKAFTTLPNFDAEIFFDITGVKI